MTRKGGEDNTKTTLRLEIARNYKTFGELLVFLLEEAQLLPAAKFAAALDDGNIETVRR
ncbi:hypothetical protein [Hyphomonas sp.]|uniref:hypothetical protein n=1 Tax=Hyphomonas sp. TaxID=87 RepID=UPI0025C60A83|nr:hypothetical protein [Hyphomonas sp.]